MTVLTAETIINGLRQEYKDTYAKVRNRESDSRLSIVMDRGVNATNRYHDFAYHEAGPHVEFWRRGEPIPQEGFGARNFRAVVHNWAKRVRWHQDDREDDQLQNLLPQARTCGESMGLLPERMFFDVLTGTASNLPAVPTAPDGAAFFATTAGGVARFGATSGNLLTGTGIASISAIQADFYAGIEQFGLFQDGKGQPLFRPETIAGGVLIIHAMPDLQAFEEAFLQRRQGIVRGSDAGTTPTNIVQDASRNVQLWASPRIATGDWYMFLLDSPVKPTFELVRRETQEQSSLRGGTAGDETMATGMEFIQWDSRKGIGLALPYGAIKINN